MQELDKIKAKLESLDQSSEIVQKSVQQNVENIHENKERTTDVVNRVEAMQREINNLRKDFDKYKSALRGELKEKGDINASTMSHIEQKINKLAERQEKLLEITKDNSQIQTLLFQLIVHEIEEDELTDKEEDKIKSIRKMLADL